MAHHFNNCQNRDHAKLFGADAFYDLSTSGVQASAIHDIQPQDYCWVASQEDGENITFSLYKFTGSRFALDSEGNSCRVLCGAFQRKESMPKTEASGNKYYSPFFDKNGNFKRQSVL